MFSAQFENWIYSSISKPDYWLRKQHRIRSLMVPLVSCLSGLDLTQMKAWFHKNSYPKKIKNTVHVINIKELDNVIAVRNFVYLFIDLIKLLLKWVPNTWQFLFILTFFFQRFSRIWREFMRLDVWIEYYMEGADWDTEIFAASSIYKWSWSWYVFLLAELYFIADCRIRA